jgi:hypothetical protein
VSVQSGGTRRPKRRDWYLLMQFECDGSLPGDHGRVVVRVDHRGPRCRHDSAGHRLPRLQGWLAKCDLTAIPFDGLPFDRRSVGRHHDVCRNPA